MFADFVRTPIPHVFFSPDFVRYLIHQNHKNADFMSHYTQYLITADFMRYYTLTSISDVCRFYFVLYFNPLVF